MGGKDQPRAFQLTTRTLSTSYTCQVELGVDDLSVAASEYLTFKNKIDSTGKGLACAHPQLRPRKTGVAGETNPNLEAWKEAETINYYCQPNPMGTTNCDVVSFDPKTNERTILPNTTFSFPMNKISYMHSFLLTENYAVFFAYPFYCESCWSGLVWSGLVWSGLVWSSLVWSGLVWSSLVWSGLV